MNSALQCILHVKVTFVHLLAYLVVLSSLFYYAIVLQPLVMYFNSGRFERDINVESPTKGKLAVSFAELVLDVFSTPSGSSFTPTRFKKEVLYSTFECIYFCSCINPYPWLVVIYRYRNWPLIY